FIYCYNIYILFFFSSRRRHTRSKRDWSSDVCSSDLPFSVALQLGFGPFPPPPIGLTTIAPVNRYRTTPGSGTMFRASVLTAPCRSEERRVGKECRSWLSR